jgi:hypothetical protein
MDNEANEAMLERMQMLEEALDRAEAGVAKAGDWAIIRYECGMPKRNLAVSKAVTWSDIL